MKYRNPKAKDAWLRSGAGPMKDRRAPKGGDTNESRDLMAEAEEETPPCSTDDLVCGVCGEPPDTCDDECIE